MDRGQRAAAPGSRLDCETLEDRATPAAAYALGATGLVAFDTADPAAATPIPLAGVAPNESLVGIDFAPDKALYALGVDAQADAATLYRVSVQTGLATAVGAPGSVKFTNPTGGPLDLPDPEAAEYGLDFDPATGTLRVVTSSGLNFRVGPDGAPIDGDSGLPGAVGGVNPDGAINGLPPDSTGVRETAFGPDPAQPGATRQYVLDAGSDALFAQAALQSGTQTQRVDVTLDGERLDFTDVAGFDVSKDGAVAALTVGGSTRLYALDLATGAATELGAAPAGAADVALAPPGGEIAFAGAAFTAPEGTMFAAVTLTRTGDASSAVSVTVASTGGTATAGADFLPGPYVVTFAPGQSIATLTIPLSDDGVAEPDETVELALSAPTGGATLGAQAAATVTITDAVAPPVPTPPPGPPPAPPGLVLGTGIGAGAVNVLNADGTLRSAFLPYGEGMQAGVRVATGDVTGDGVADVITAPALGAAHVKVFDGVSGAEVRSFLAFDPGFQGGLSVAAGDVDGDGVADIVVGTASGSSHVKAFSGATGAELRSFFAYDLFGGGVTVAAGDVNGDGRADIVTGTASYNSHVKVFDGGSLAVLRSQYAFIGQAGVTVAAGDVDGDGKSDVVVGTAAGAAQVKVISGASGEVIRSVRAFVGYTGGVNVAARDLNGDGLADFLAATASGASHVKGFDAVTSAEISSFLAFGAGFYGGAFVS